jgi:hypothetical protein
MALGISEQQAISICASPAFARKLSISSPYRDFSELVDAARNIWWKEIGPSEWLSAFAAHPRIGESKAADERSEEFAAFSRSEQVMYSALATCTDVDIICITPIVLTICKLRKLLLKQLMQKSRKNCSNGINYIMTNSDLFSSYLRR